MRWALDHGHYPPWTPAEPKYENTEMVTITRPFAPHSLQERSDQTPEKRSELEGAVCALPTPAEGGARRSLNIEGGLGTSMQEVRLYVVLLYFL